MKKLVMHKKFEPLFVPNRSAAEMVKYEDPVYKAGLIKRMLSGEVVKASEFGAKTFLLKSGRSSGKTQHGLL